MSQWHPDIRACLLTKMAAPTMAPATSNATEDAKSDMCRGAGGMDMSKAMEFLVGLCQSKPSCQWAPPLTSPACSSTSFYRATDGNGFVTGAEKKMAYAKMCDELQTNWW